VLHIVEKRVSIGIDIKYRFNGGLFNLHRLKAKTLTSLNRVTELQYADDNAIVAHSEEDLQKAVDAFQYAYSSLGLRLNSKKTQILYQPSPDIPKHSICQPSITADGELLDNVEHFSYLGSTLSSNANIDREIEKRLHAASAAYGRLTARVFENRDLRTNTKLAVYRAVVLTTLLYGSETWVTYSKNLQAPEQYNQRCLRRIMNVHWSEYRTNNSIHTESGIASVEALIVKNKMRWTGHVVRMDSRRLPVKLLYSELSNGKRKQGGQRKRFKDNLKHYLKKGFFNLNTWEYCAQERSKWRHKVHQAMKIFEDNRMRHREDLRQARKQRITNLTVESSSFICTYCQRQCKSRIGLISHLRTHSK
jgi:hypothetical protein